MKGSVILLRSIISSQSWLDLVGKDRLQAYQDSYARLHGISLVFLDTDGKPLTVWSNASLFCYAVSEKSRQRCIEETLRKIARAKVKREMDVSRCFLGLTNFFFPIYYDNQLVAFCLGGNVADEDTPLAEEMIQTFHVPHFKLNALQKVVTNLQLSLRLLNLDVERIIQRDLEYEKQGKSVFEGKLSKRETEVAKAICSGLTNKQVADLLFISEKTVKSHVSNILLKLNLRDRVQLVVDYCRFVSNGIGDTHEHKKEN